MKKMSSYQLVYTDPNFLVENNYGKVAHVPCIFDARPGFHRLGSEYLIDRALGRWSPTRVETRNFVRPPSSKSIKNYGSWLCNFLEWCDCRLIDPLNIDLVEDLIGKYQREMIEGVWSRDNRSLSEKTINVRVDSALDFLAWAEFRGYRIRKQNAQYTIYDDKSLVAANRRARAKTSSGTRLRESNSFIVLPDTQALISWRARVGSRPVRGNTEVLIVDLIMESAIRITEASCWRVDTLPLAMDDWDIINPAMPDRLKLVSLKICYGTKGPDYGYSHGDKIGPEGRIRISYELALRIQYYRKNDRPHALGVAIKSAVTLKAQRRIRDESVQLFLNPVSGLRYTADQIYEVWRLAIPPKGWSPHRARDYWACSLLWERMDEQRRMLVKFAGTEFESELLIALRANAETCILLEILPQMRHKSKETTLIYLKWFTDNSSFALNFHLKWTEELCSDSDKNCD